MQGQGARASSLAVRRGWAWSPTASRPFCAISPRHPRDRRHGQDHSRSWAGISPRRARSPARHCQRLTDDLVRSGQLRQPAGTGPGQTIRGRPGLRRQGTERHHHFPRQDLSEKLQSRGSQPLHSPAPGSHSVRSFRRCWPSSKADRRRLRRLHAEHLELGGKASTLKLKASAIFDTIFALLEAKDFVIGIYRILDAARTAQRIRHAQFASAYAAAAAVAAAGGGKPRLTRRRPAATRRASASAKPVCSRPRGISGDIRPATVGVPARAMTGAGDATISPCVAPPGEPALRDGHQPHHQPHGRLDAAYDQAYLRSPD